MKVAIYTLTRDRIWSTKHCLPLLREKAGMPFTHFVVDNGSQDETLDWLQNEYRPDWLHSAKQNLGISRASNLALSAIFQEMPDVELVIKADNDAEILSDGLLAQMVLAYQELARPLASKWVISPCVSGIANQPRRAREFWTKNFRIGETSIVGGLFHLVPADIYREYRYPENLPLARGQDDHFCEWVKEQGGHVGYVENLSVGHYLTTEGQCAKDFPYFERKWQEEK